ncbi:MAG: DUF5947 family protein [Gemmatimonadota bacterium]|nr:DUF5947 family protein [Gemmatimonadota bacterium]
MSDSLDFHTSEALQDQGIGIAASSLRRFLEPKAKPRPGERCEFCGEPLAESHSHVAHLETRGMSCACRPCYLLFTTRGAAGGKYVAIPDRYLAARDLGFTNAQWDALQIPVGIAFLFQNSSQGRTVAFYPSPAGATESLLPLDTWSELVQQSPLLATLEPDVEALLARKTSDGIAECFVVPIDACYELVGRMRRVWRGFDGGEDAWTQIDAFFAEVRERCGEPVDLSESSS